MVDREFLLDQFDRRRHAAFVHHHRCDGCGFCFHFRPDEQRFELHAQTSGGHATTFFRFAGDAQALQFAAPVFLLADVRHHDGRLARERSGLRRAGAAVMDHRAAQRKNQMVRRGRDVQDLVVRFKAALAPAGTLNNRAAAGQRGGLRQQAQRGALIGDVAGHPAAEGHVHRFRASGQERRQRFGHRAFQLKIGHIQKAGDVYPGRPVRLALAYLRADRHQRQSLRYPDFSDDIAGRLHIVQRAQAVRIVPAGPVQRGLRQPPQHAIADAPQQGNADRMIERARHRRVGQQDADIRLGRLFRRDLQGVHEIMADQELRVDAQLAGGGEHGIFDRGEAEAQNGRHLHHWIARVVGRLANLLRFVGRDDRRGDHVDFHAVARHHTAIRGAVDAGDEQSHFMAGQLQAFRQREKGPDISVAAPGLHPYFHLASALGFSEVQLHAVAGRVPEK